MPGLRPMWFFLLVATAVMAGCGSRSAAQPAPVSSTEGSTVVQKGVVTGIDDRGGAIRLTVRLEDGTLAAWDVEAGHTFRVGDPVNITTRRGQVMITH